MLVPRLLPPSIQVNDDFSSFNIRPRTLDDDPGLDFKGVQEAVDRPVAQPTTMLGGGAFGDIYLGYNFQKKEEVAIKLVVINLI